MKRMLGFLACALLTALPALAANGGITGRVFDAAGTPVAGAPVAIFRMPVNDRAVAVSTLKTDRNGYFSNIALTPGRYLVSAEVGGKNVACTIDNVVDGWNTRMLVRASPIGTRCTGPRVHAAWINSGITADTYIVH